MHSLYVQLLMFNRLPTVEQLCARTCVKLKQNLSLLFDKKRRWDFSLDVLQDNKRSGEDKKEYKASIDNGSN